MRVGVNFSAQDALGDEGCERRGRLYVPRRCGTIGTVVIRRLCLTFVVLLALSFLWGWGRPVPADAQGERLVLAFYYAWYDMTMWQKPLPDQPAQPYTSTDSVAIERHVLWAKQAGIDGFVQSWYGPQVEYNQTEPNFAALLDIAAQHGFAAAVDFELVSPFFHSEADVVAALEYLLTVHAQHPAYLRVGGRPVVFFWRQGRYPLEWWYSVREQVDPQHGSIWIAEGVDLDYLGPFDGNHLYSVAWDPDPEGVLRRWGQRIRNWTAEHGPPARYWVATVMPGYDDLVTGRSDAFVRDRAGGAYYRRCWEGAVQGGADWVILTSFNEWEEGTQIEPSVGYGDFYLGLTRELADLYRAGGSPEQEPVPTVAASPTETAAFSPIATPTVPPTLPAEASTLDSGGSVRGETTMASPTPTPTAAPTPTVTPTGTPTPPPTPTATSVPTPTPSPTRTPLPTPTCFVPDTATPMPATTGRATAWAGGGWVLGAAVALLALGAVLQALRLRREVIGG